MRDKHVVSVLPHSTMREAAIIMAEHNFGALPVTQHCKLVGIVTERDLMNRVIAEGRDVDETCVGDVMTPNPKTISRQSSLFRALQVMENGRFRHLPVTEEGMIVGILSFRDIPLHYHVMHQNWVEALSPNNGQKSAA
ncbi:MAG: CBS domain-containing protein [Hyphomicrobiales bacterium]|nr:CBS domain-containing protein [Hyphomicrobiales bacterium]